MSSAQTEKLFEPFSQADTSTTRKYGGTGLGLVISKRLVEMMDGEIWVESELNKGSTFFFTAAFTLTEEKQSRALSPDAPLYGARTLIVSEHLNDLERMQTILSSLSLDVHTASSTQQALLMIHHQEQTGNPVEWLFIDEKRGDTDDLQSLNQIWQDKNIFWQDKNISYPPTTILITATVAEEINEYASTIQADAILLKPVTHSMILKSMGALRCKREGIPCREEQSGFTIEIGTPQFQPCRVLLVEDNRTNQTVAKGFLEKAGLTVDIAENGQDAITKCHQHHYALILMDIQMPLLDGFQATAAIRQIKSYIDTPIIAMTAHASTSDRERSLHAGMNDHIGKPFAPQHFYQTLQRWLPLTEMNSTSMVDTTGTLTHDTPTAMVLPGVDTNDGINKTCNDLQVYQKMLQEFHQDHHNTSQQITQLLDDDQPRKAEQLAHTIKGAAGNLGAVPLSKYADLLESSIREGKITSSTLENFQKEAEKVMSGLAKLGEIAPNNTPNNLQSTDSKALKTVIQRLTQMLKSATPDAIELIPNLKQLLGTEHHNNLLKLQNYLNNFQFEEALQILKIISQKTSNE